jgi:hypothetical protein
MSTVALEPIALTQIASADRAIDPVKLCRSLQDADIEVLGAAFREAKSVGQRAWMAMTIAIGIAVERLPDEKRAVLQLSRSFEMHRSRLSRLSRIYRDIIKPRIKERGSADFFLGEMSFYIAAVDSAKRTGMSALELIEFAEEKKILDSRYSTRQFKDDILGRNVPDGAVSLGRQLADCLDYVAAAPDDVVRALSEEALEPRQWLKTLDSVNETLTRLRRDLELRATPPQSADASGTARSPD